MPRGSRPQGDNPRTGTAVPRGSTPPPVVSGGSGSGPTIIVRRPPVYSYYYPQRYYPYGYGGFGLGYFYYDPYAWYPGVYSGYGYNSPYPYSRSISSFDSGHLRLHVSPRDAQVYVDGYYVGVVDDFDGIVQALQLESGPYRIEVVAPGYEPLEFDVRIIRGRKITYRGTLIPRP